ncbi:unnamed protein product [Linum trigynum]|uniref:Uncharacterized protein n=1 Tax=Linum trigynum TaxID=586398 RepID=A0AAV2E2Q3_9ROSI
MEGFGSLVGIAGFGSQEPRIRGRKGKKKAANPGKGASDWEGRMGGLGGIGWRKVFKVANNRLGVKGREEIGGQGLGHGNIKYGEI